MELNLNGLRLDANTLSWLAGASFMTLSVLWWLIRKQRKVIWFPLLKILPPGRPTPKQITWSHPPWLDWLMWLLLFGVTSFLYLRPFGLSSAASDLEEPSEVLVLIDQSFSLSSQIDTTEYKKWLQSFLSPLMTLVKRENSKSVVTKVYLIGSAQGGVTNLEDLNWNKLDLRFNTPDQAGQEYVTHRSMCLAKPSCTLVVVSDRDSDFWDSFPSKMPRVLRVEPFEKFKEGVNYFVDSAWLTPDVLGTWQLELRIERAPLFDTEKSRPDASVDESSLLDGKKIEVEWILAEKTIQSWEISFQQGQKISELNVSLTPAQVDLVRRAKGGSGRIRLTVSDLLLEDNQTLLFQKPLPPLVHLYAKTESESLLSGRVHAIRTALEMSGARVALMSDTTNLAQLKTNSPRAEVPDGVLFLEGPQSLGDAKIKEIADDLSAYLKTQNRGRVWILPRTTGWVSREYCKLTFMLSSAMKNPKVDSVVQDTSTLCDGASNPVGWLSALKKDGWHESSNSINVEDIDQPVSVYASTDQLRSWFISFAPSELVSRAWTYVWIKDFVKDLEKGRSVEAVVEDFSEALLSKEQMNLVPKSESRFQWKRASELPPIFEMTGVNDIVSDLKEARGGSMTEVKSYPLLGFIFYFLIGYSFLQLAVLVLRRMRRPKLGQVVSIVSSIVLPLTATLGTVISLGLSERAASQSFVFSPTGESKSLALKFSRLSMELDRRTSLKMSTNPRAFNFKNPDEGWVWLSATSFDRWPSEIAEISRRGLLLVVEGQLSDDQISRLVSSYQTDKGSASYTGIGPDHAIFKSFHLLKRLPGCGGGSWDHIVFDQKSIVIVIPFAFSEAVSDGSKLPACLAGVDQEELTRVFINLLMYAQTLDYKLDQIHLPEILKRIR